MSSARGDGSRPLWQRLAWFVAIWAASITALGVVAFVIRLFIG